jgi:hypothetical protein
MSDNLPAAAAAAEREWSLTADELDELIGERMASPMRVRDVLLRIAALEERRAQLEALKRSIIDRYDHSITQLDRQIQRFRQSVEAWILQANEGRSVSFPDVGTAYLQTVAEKVEVADREAFERWAQSRRILREVVDLPRAKEEALRLLKATGEIAPGAEYVPERKALRIRKVAL